MKYLILSTIFLIILMPSNIYAGNQCEVVNFSTYEKMGGYAPEGGGYVDIDVKKCATITVHVSSSPYTHNYKLTATFADGKTKTRNISGINNISNFDSSSREFTVSRCFGESRSEIVSIDCD